MESKLRVTCVIIWKARVGLPVMGGLVRGLVGMGPVELWMVESEG